MNKPKKRLSGWILYMGSYISPLLKDLHNLGFETKITSGSVYYKPRVSK